MENLLWVGVDTGGTFTDFVILGKENLEIRKIPSTPENPSRAIHEGIKDLLQKNIPLFVVHGTTVATNALLERKGGRIALITTKGYEDVLLIGRQSRKNLYGLDPEKRELLLPKQFCFGIDERTASSGHVEKKPSLKDIKHILDMLEKHCIEAVAVSFINSYADPSNEELVARELYRRSFPSSISSRILPEHREYERTSVASVNAYLIPVISRYIDRLIQKLGGAELKIMQSNEGYISPQIAKKEPIRTALSGPAGGVVAAFNLGRSAGYNDLITFDMGGTSTDVSLVDGKIRRTHESMIGDFPIRLPFIDIHTVGAGGGSIAYRDRGGALRVGPQSAGADPGPACYGIGKRPTVTDANLFLGRLVPEYFLGGKMKLHPEKSSRALKILASEIGKPAVDVAAGIIDVANSAMEKAIRVISIERGMDPRNFALFSFGGAGGMHAVEIAEHLQIPKVIIPKNAGVLSAYGLLLADSVKDYSLSILKLTGDVKSGQLIQSFEKLARTALKDMMQEGFKEKSIKILSFVDLRYLGQSYEITLPVRLITCKPGSMAERFHKAHQEIYSYHNPHRSVEIVNIRVKSIGAGKKRPLPRFPKKGRSAKKAFLKTQGLTYGKKQHSVSVYERNKLEAGNRICGPALVLDVESTTFLPPLSRLEVDEYLNIIIERHA